MLGMAPGAALLLYVLAEPTGRDDEGWLAVAAGCLALGLGLATRAIIQARATGRVGFVWRAWLAIGVAVAALLLWWAWHIGRNPDAYCIVENPSPEDEARCAAWVAENEASANRWALGMAATGMAIVTLLVASRSRPSASDDELTLVRSNDGRPPWD